MSFSKALRLLASPMKLFAYLRLRHQRSDYYLTLSKVTHAESAMRLHDKIRALDQKIADL